MFSEPFKTDLDCITTIAEFLLDHCDKDHSLWTESVEELCRLRPVFSLWTTADITLSLLDLAEYLQATTLLLESDSAIKKEIDTLHSRILNQVNETIKKFNTIYTEITEYSKKQKQRDLNQLRKIAEDDPAGCHKILTEVVREAMGYSGFPRSYSHHSDSSKHGTWGAANLIASCYVHTTLVRLNDLNKNNNNQYVSKLLDSLYNHISQPELGLLRKAIKNLDLTNIDKISCLSNYWNQLKFEYNEQRKNLAKTFSDSLKQLLPPYGTDPEDIPTTIADLLNQNEFECGSFWIDEQKNGGWMTVPFQTGAGNDPIATLAALGVLASAPLQDDSSQEARQKVLGVFEQGLSQLEYIAKKKPEDSDDCWRTELQSAHNLSDWWSLGLVCRLVLGLIYVEKHFGTNSPFNKIDADKQNNFSKRISFLREVMYTALLVKIFKIEVDIRSPPYEVVPTALLAGNEISHWPGLDTGLVALVLLKGWPLYNWTENKENYSELADVKDRLCPPSLGNGKDKPLVLPLFHETTCMIKKQIVGYHNQDMVQKHLNVRGYSKDSHALLGAFLANAGSVPGREYYPTIYLWATAHALSALVEWRRTIDEDQKKAELHIKETKRIRDQHHEELSAAQKKIECFKVHVPNGRWENLAIPTVFITILPLLSSIVLDHTANFVWILITFATPSALWWIWLSNVVKKRAIRAGAKPETAQHLGIVSIMLGAILILSVTVLMMVVNLDLKSKLLQWTNTQINIIYLIAGLVVTLLFFIFKNIFGFKDFGDRVRFLIITAITLLFKSPDQKEYLDNLKINFKKTLDPFRYSDKDKI